MFLVVTFSGGLLSGDILAATTMTFGEGVLPGGGGVIGGTFGGDAGGVSCTVCFLRPVSEPLLLPSPLSDVTYDTS